MPKLMPPQDRPTYLLVGGDGSPYSCKMRAVLRYRRIHYHWRPQYSLSVVNNIFDDYFPDLKARVIPVLVKPDGSYSNDSTPLILELEANHPERTDRSVIPANPGDAFLAALVEDFGDEWMTKVMFEGRFNTARDGKFGAAWQFWQGPPLAVRNEATRPKAVERLDNSVAAFAERQVSRREKVVGKPPNWEKIQQRTLQEVSTILEGMWRGGQPFIMGDRPTNADFGLFGQLRQCATDPRPARVMHDYPLAWSWVWMMDELNGLEPPADSGGPGSKTAMDVPNDTLSALLRLIADVYVPFLVGNYDAYILGKKEFTVPIFSGKEQHCQAPFGYQAKYCMVKLSEQFQALAGSDRDYVVAALRAAGCDAEAIFTRTGKAVAKL